VQRPIMFSALGAWLVLLPCSVVAQAPNEFDFDTTQLAVTTIPPNGATHAITTAVTYTGQNLVLNAPLVVRANAELRLVRSVLTVHGSILMEDGSRVTVIDSSVLLPNQYQHQYEMRNEGGLLHTERAVIGSGYQGNALHHTRLLHLRGTWVARQTVVQGMGAVLANGRVGWFGDPRHKGGSVFADGLYEGDRADAVHMSGVGDAVLANGTMNVGLYYDAGASTQPVAATINLDSRSPLDIVYGDPVVHSNVTAPIVAHPCRLEMRNHRSVTWQFFAVNASSSGPLHTLTLANAEEVIASFHGNDLVGTPVLGGPWSTYYGELPGLPSTTRPGHHAMPPGCSIRLGNVKFQSGPGVNDWNRIRSWGLYPRGANTNLTITGPSLIAEIIMSGGQLRLNGTGSYEMGIHANIIRLQANANLQIDNAAIGEFVATGGLVALVEATENSSCTITNSRMAPVRLHTTSAAASITGQNLIGVQNIVVDPGGGGSIQVVQASPTQSWDLQNLGFESPLAGGLPPYWSATALSGSLPTDPAPGSTGTKSYELVAQSGAVLQKQVTLSPGTFVTVVGAAKVLQYPTGGAQLLLRAANGATTMSKAVGPQLNTWQRVHVPLLTVGTAASPTLLQFVAGGLPARVRLDDYRVQVGSWWDTDNFGNVGFELGYRFSGMAPNYWSAPDAWNSFQVRCSGDTGNVRPGAAPGSRSLRMDLTALNGHVYKDLTFLRHGDTAVVRGWTRGVSPGQGVTQAAIGDGPNFFVLGLGSNQQTPAMLCDGVWRSFMLTYVVPSNPTYTRLNLACYDVPGTQCWFDDITVEIQ